MTSLPSTLKQFLLKEPSAESLTGFGPIRSAPVVRATPYKRRPIAAAMADNKELPLPKQNPLFQYPPLDITGTLNPAKLIAELIERAADSPKGENPESYFATAGGVQGYFIPIPPDVRTTVDEHGHIIAYRDPMSKFHKPANVEDAGHVSRVSTRSKSDGNRKTSINRKTSSSQHKVHQHYIQEAPPAIGSILHKAPTKRAVSVAKLPRSNRPAARHYVI